MLLRRLFALLLCATCACGARSGLRDERILDAGLDAGLDAAFDATDSVVVDAFDATTDLPLDLTERIDAVCPSPLSATQGATVALVGRGVSSLGLPLSFRWTIERAPAGSTARPTPDDQATTRFTFDTAGEWLFRLSARSASGGSESCTVRATVAPAIDLLCPNDQSIYQGATVPLVASVSSRLGLPVTLAWTTDARPSASATTAVPANAARAALTLDALGDWRLRLSARDTAGNTVACVTNVHSDPDVIVACPPDVTTRPFTTATLRATARSRLGLPLTVRWEAVEQPVTSTAALENASSLDARASFDVAGRWTWRFTATNGRGGAASCTTRGFAASDEAVRVELVWNVDRSCRTCNDRGGGLDLDLHLTDRTRSEGHWNALAPDDSDCYWSNCKCFPVGRICADGVLSWPPDGRSNNPQLDVDHNDDLPGPENINILTATAGSRFDVGVHFFGDNSRSLGVETTAAIVRVYCAGAVVFESEPVRLGPVRTRSESGPGTDANPLWRVGQITLAPEGCVFTRCGAPGAVSECIRPANRW